LNNLCKKITHFNEYSQCTVIEAVKLVYTLFFFCFTVGNLILIRSQLLLINIFGRKIASNPGVDTFREIGKERKMSNEKILVIDDDPDIRNACMESLRFGGGYEVETAGAGEEALKIMEVKFFNIVLTDLKMVGMNGIEVLKQVRKIHPSTEIIVFTAYGTIESAVEAMKMGAYDYITKPLDLDMLNMKIIKCLEKQRLTSKAGMLDVITGLYEASKNMVAPLKLEQFLNAILKFACDTLSADGGSLMLLDKETKVLSIKASIGLKEEIVKSTRVKIGDRISGWIVQTGEPLLLIDGFTDKNQFKDIERRNEIKSSICVPLKVRYRTIGVLNLNDIHRSRCFTEDDLEVLNLFACEASLSIENALLFENLEECKKHLEKANKELEEKNIELKAFHEEKYIKKILAVKKEKSSKKEKGQKK